MVQKLSLFLLFIPLFECLSELPYNNEDFSSSFPPPNSKNLKGDYIYEKYLDQIISRGILNLTLEMNKAVLINGGNENIICSPVNIASALALLLLGANGNTFQELVSILGLSSFANMQNNSQRVHEEFGKILESLRESGEVEFATGIFVHQDFPIRDLYLSTARTLYDSSVFNLNFIQNPTDAKNRINEWVNVKTHSKIKKMLDFPPLPSTKMILASAMHFKATWMFQFFHNVTEKKPFYVNGIANPSDFNVDMMFIVGDLPHYKDDVLNCEIIGFPYKNNYTTMYVVIPENSSKDKLKDFQMNLKAEDVDRLIGHVRTKHIRVQFPKMHFESESQLKNILERLGLHSLFNPQQANLALLASNGKNKNISSLGSLDNLRQFINEQNNPEKFENPKIYVDKIVHKIFMDIHEIGTEAAAVTYTVLKRGGVYANIMVNVPFLFFIRDHNTKSTLFWGSIVTPTPNFL